VPISNRANTVLLILILAVGIGIVAMLASGARGGPLDPPGAPASTMHTLDELYTTANNVPQSWDRKLDSTNGSFGFPLLPAGCNSDRFQCVFWRQITLSVSAYDGVLDRETGLVWQRAPSISAGHWDAARQYCATVNTGGRNGWRLPTTAEFLSLRDESIATDPQLPSGNPFVMSQTGTGWWTSTENLSNPADADAVSLGPNSQLLASPEKANSALSAWCVRGPTSRQ
jgi:hypothetical protein